MLDQCFPKSSVGGGNHLNIGGGLQQQCNPKNCAAAGDGRVFLDLPASNAGDLGVLGGWRALWRAPQASKHFKKKLRRHHQQASYYAPLPILNGEPSHDQGTPPPPLSLSHPICWNVKDWPHLVHIDDAGCLHSFLLCFSFCKIPTLV